MCGLIGMVGDIPYQMRSGLFKDMLDVCQVRGRDSTGVIKVQKDLEYTWAKQIGSPHFLYESSMYDKLITTGEAAALIGHCRAKTVGEVSVKNAHPFDFPEKGIVGVHNGTLTGHSKLDTYVYGKVDSEVLYGHLAENGPEDTFNRLEGAWACIWWDNEKKTLNFIRNSQRPLWFTWSKDMRTMFFASELWMFGVISRKLDLWDGGKEKKVYYQLPENHLWSFRIKPDAKKDDPVITMLPQKEILVEKKYLPVTGNYAAHGGSGGNYRGGKWVHGKWVPNEAKQESWRDLNDWKQSPADKSWHRQSSIDKMSLEEKEKLGFHTPSQKETKGGSVANPFLMAVRDELDDDPPFVTSREKTGTSGISNVAFLRNSVNGTDSKTGSTTSNSSPRPTLSLVHDSTSKDSTQKTKNDGTSSASDGCTTESQKTALSILPPFQHSEPARKGVTFRTISGIEYVSSLTTGKEVVLETLLENTEAKCSFCKGLLGSEKEIGEVISEDRLVCVDCIKE